MLKENTMVIENKYIEKYPVDKLSTSLGAEVFSHYSLEDKNDSNSTVKFTNIFRGAQSNRVIADVREDEKHFLTVTANPHAETIFDATLVSAKCMVDNHFKFREISDKERRRIVRGTLPQSFGAIKWSQDGCIYVLTYIFVDDKILDDSSLIDSRFTVIDIDTLKRDYELSDFSKIFADNFIGIESRQENFEEREN